MQNSGLCTADSLHGLESALFAVGSNLTSKPNFSLLSCTMSKNDVAEYNEQVESILIDVLQFSFGLA